MLDDSLFFGDRAPNLIANRKGQEQNEENDIDGEESSPFWVPGRPEGQPSGLLFILPSIPL